MVSSFLPFWWEIQKIWMRSDGTSNDCSSYPLESILSFSWWFLHVSDTGDSWRETGSHRKSFLQFSEILHQYPPARLSRQLSQQRWRRIISDHSRSWYSIAIIFSSWSLTVCHLLIFAVVPWEATFCMRKMSILNHSAWKRGNSWLELQYKMLLWSRDSIL